MRKYKKRQEGRLKYDSGEAWKTSYNNNERIITAWTSRAVQWLRICLLIQQGDRLDPWSGKTPHVMGKLSLREPPLLSV